MADEYIRRKDAAKLLGYIFGVDVVRRLHEVPAADVAPMVCGKPITKIREVTITEYHEARGVFASDGSNVYIKKMVYAKVPYDHCPVCGAVLCSRWHNYCGKCGAKMDGGNENDP